MPEYIHWMPAKPNTCHLILRKPPELLSRHERWRRTAKILHLSKQALLRLDWIIWYETKGHRNALHTARHFGIARKTFHKWLNRFDESHLGSLETQSSAPKHVRKKNIPATNMNESFS